MHAINSPVKVVNADGLHKFSAGAVEQHVLINEWDTSFFLQLSLFPGKKTPTEKTGLETICKNTMKN